MEETAYTLLAEVGIELEQGSRSDAARPGLPGRANRVYMPRDVVAWGLKNVTPHNEFYNRDGSHAFTFGDGRCASTTRRPAVPLRP